MAKKNKLVLPSFFICFLIIAITVFFFSPKQKIVTAKLPEYTVTRIVDGDTIELSNGVQVRYIGIDTPETGQPGADVATLRNKELIGSNKVILERDILYKDRFNRILAYVWVNGTMVNNELAREGLAWPLFIPPDIKYKTEISKSISLAKQEKKGLWK